MAFPQWQTPFWPDGVKNTCEDYKFPIFKFLDDSARDYPDLPFTIFEGASKTFAQVKDTADRIATFLHEKGISKGDKVAIFLPNLPHYPEILFGITKIGAVAVNCNPVYTPSELNHQLKDSESKIVFCMDHPIFYPNAVKAVEGTSVENIVLCNIKSYLPWIKGFLGGLLGKLPKADNISSEHLMYDDIVASTTPNLPEVSIDPEKDTAMMLYTGGTTGLPKGAQLVHTNFTSDCHTIFEFARFVHKEGGPEEHLYGGGFHTFLGVLPWYHCFGLTVALLLAAKLAGKLVCIPDPRAGNPPFTAVLKAVKKYKPTFMPAVPTIYVAFINHAYIDKYDLSSFMGCFSGGAPLPPEVLKQFEDKTGAIIFEGYGLTETAPVVSVNPTDKSKRRIGSIGFPLPETDIKIVDLEDPSKVLDRCEDGELAICGPMVMKGYWKQPEANKTSFVTIEGNRYFLTGDIAHIDEDGYIVITDRKKDIILVSGFNVYPRDVEDTLYTNSKIELAAVIGVPDEKRGERVKAFIQLKEGQDASMEEMLAFCKENMAGYKRPRDIEFRDEIPVSAVGKVLRRVLRDEELKALK